jgi:hypothetical protein
MKRENFRYRTMPLAVRVVRPIENPPNLFRLSSVNGYPSVHSKKIFVIKEVQRLPATTAARRKIQRILIFDNHPASLRLVFDRRADSHIHLVDPEPVSSVGIALIWILVVGLMMVMFWPIR